MSDQDVWLTVSDAARRVGCSPATIRLKTDCGELPGIRTVGGQRLFLEHEVLAFARKWKHVNSKTWSNEESCEASAKSTEVG